MNPFHLSEQRFIDDSTSLSLLATSGSSSDETGFGQGIGSDNCIWTNNFFADQTPDITTGFTGFHSTGNSTDIPNPVPQTCGCVTAEYVLDLQIRVANLERGQDSRLADLEAKFEELYGHILPLSHHLLT